MRRWIVVPVSLVLLAFPSALAAGQEWTWRARASVEAQALRTSDAPAEVATSVKTWSTGSLFVAAADSSWEAASRVKLAGGLIVSGDSTSGLRLQAREAYARLSATSWLDVEAGKRLVRWGVGYGFSPTGVLDPPRLPTDPADRLGRNEGMPLARADMFRGATSLTIAVASPALWRNEASPLGPSRLLAARLRTVLPAGLELGVVASASAGHRPAIGGNVTHVLGQRLEWHAEALVHDRTLTAAAGFQYTRAGINTVIEYHRRRIDGPGRSASNQLFVRAARAGADRKLMPELIVVRSLDGGGWTSVGGVTWRVRQRLEVYTRGTLVRQAGGAPGRSRRADLLALGATVKF